MCTPGNADYELFLSSSEKGTRSFQRAFPYGPRLSPACKKARYRIRLQRGVVALLVSSARASWSFLIWGVSFHHSFRMDAGAWPTGGGLSTRILKRDGSAPAPSFVGDSSRKHDERRKNMRWRYVGTPGKRRESLGSRDLETHVSFDPFRISVEEDADDPRENDAESREANAERITDAKPSKPHSCRMAAPNGDPRAHDNPELGRAMTSTGPTSSRTSPRPLRGCYQARCIPRGKTDTPSESTNRTRSPDGAPPKEAETPLTASCALTTSKDGTGASRRRAAAN